MNSIWKRIRSLFWFKSHQEVREETIRNLRQSIQSQQIGRAVGISPQDAMKITRGAENIPHPKNIPQATSKKGMRARSILEDWEVTQDSV